LAKKLGKHTPYFELVEAQSQAGCPICRLVYKATDRYLDSILYEAVLDPDVRAKLKGARGFCAQHVKMLRNKPGRALGIALIYRDIIRSIAQEVAKGPPQAGGSFLGRLLGRRPTRREAASPVSCPACAIGRQAEENYVELLLAHLEDEKLYTAYAQGEGLCLPHLLLALERAPDEATRRRLLEPQLARYQAMLADLDEFIRKRDYRFRGESYGEEGDVWLRAMNAVVGGAGLGLSARSGGRPSLEEGGKHDG